MAVENAGLTAEQAIENAEKATQETNVETPTTQTPDEQAGGEPTSETAKTEVAVEPKAEEVPQDLTDQLAKANKEIARRAGVIKTSQQKIKELQTALQGKPQAQAARKAAEPRVDDYGDPVVPNDDALSQIRQELDETKRANAEILAEIRGQRLLEAQNAEAVEQHELEENAVGACTSFCSNLFPKGLDEKGLQEQQELTDALARQEFLRMLSRDNLTTEEFFATPDLAERIQEVATTVRSRYMKTAAIFGTRQLKDNLEANKQNKLKPEGATGLPKGKTVDDMTPAERQAYWKDYEQRKSGV
jgi:hypothetical protein